MVSQSISYSTQTSIDPSSHQRASILLIIDPRYKFHGYTEPQTYVAAVLLREQATKFPEISADCCCQFFAVNEYTYGLLRARVYIYRNPGIFAKKINNISLFIFLSKNSGISISYEHTDL